MTKGTWSDLPFLDALRPAPAWRTDFAVIGTYSLDLYALVATLLALAGVDDERGSGTKIDFANAMDELRGRVCVLAQRGRVAAPSKAPKIMAILDQFVLEVPLDERQASWHPKIAIAKHVSDDGEMSEWRCWLGSRNLSRDLSWDAGLYMSSTNTEIGRKVPGLAELIEKLIRRSSLDTTSATEIMEELASTLWEVPEGCEIDYIGLYEGGGRSLPKKPENINQLTVISPFVDGSLLSTLGSWGDGSTQRRIVSIPSTIGKLYGQVRNPLKDFDDILQMYSPQLDLSYEGNEDPLDCGLDEEEELRGLHAKIIYARHSQGTSMWLGSANTTRRGWYGPNSEVVASLNVSNQIADELDRFTTEICIEVTEGSLKFLPVEPESEPLEDARKQIAAEWSVVQQVSSQEHFLNAQIAPTPFDPKIRLSVRLLGQKDWIKWPHNALTVSIPLVTFHGDLTEFVECQLKSGEASIAWLQLTPLDPPLEIDRDSDAMARFLDPRTFLLWIRNLLTRKALTDGGGEWHETEVPTSSHAAKHGPLWDAPTLEEILKAWSRDPDYFQLIDRKVKHYLEWIAQQPKGEQDEEYLKLLMDFKEVWKVVEQELVGHTL